MRRLKFKPGDALEARCCYRLEGEGDAQKVVLFCEVRQGRRRFVPIAKRYPGQSWINLEPGFRVSGTEPGTDYKTICIDYDPAYGEEN
jgi:hypothetical protein